MTTPSMRFLIMQDELKEKAKKIRSAMIQQGVTFKDLARLTGYTEAHLSRVVHGHSTSDKTRKVIALVLGDVRIWD